MKDFERFKKKVLREHIFKSILVGLGIGLLAAALAIVISFLTNPDAALLMGIIAGVVFAGAGGYYYWFKTKPTDKQIALLVDKKLNLHERCATMVEFKDKEGVFVEKQREDTKTKLSEKPTKSLKFSLSIWVVPALAVASAFFGASFLTPKNNNRPEDISIVESSNSDNIIDSLTSSLGDKAKSEIHQSGVDSELQSIFESIVNKVTDSLSGKTDTDDRSDIVNNGKSEIDDVIDDWNSKDEIGKALKTEQDQHLKNQGQHLIDGNTQGIRQDFQDLFNDLSQLEGEELRDYANELADEIDDALDKAKMAGVSEDDDLYRIYKELANRLRGISEMSQSPSSGSEQQNSQVNQAVESVMANAASAAASNVNEQNQNEQLASAIKSIMDSMVNPQQSNEQGSGDSGEPDSGAPGSGSASLGNGSGGSNGAPGNGDGSQDASASTNGNGGNGANSQDAPGTQGPNSEPGSGPGAGGGNHGEDPHTDIIYTGEDTVEYGSVITSYNGGFADDMTNGDEDDGDAADDYFNNLFGSDGDGNN